MVSHIDFVVEDFRKDHDLFVPRALLFEVATEGECFVGALFLIDEWKSERCWNKVENTVVND